MLNANTGLSNALQLREEYRFVGGFFGFADCLPEARSLQMKMVWSID
jgi:hypothetical protein